MANQGQRGSGFVGLNEYLKRNQEAAQKMGAGLVEGVTSEGERAERAIGDAVQDFEAKAQGGIRGSAATPGMALGRGAFEYTGPDELSDVADVDALGAQALKAEERAGALTSDAGRATLLRQQVAPNGGYTAGQAGLDAFLAGRGAAPQAEAAASKYGELRKRLGLAQEGAKATAANATKDAASAYEQYRANQRAARANQPSTRPTTPTAPVYTPATAPNGNGPTAINYDAGDKARGRRRNNTGLLD